MYDCVGDVVPICVCVRESSCDGFVDVTVVLQMACLLLIASVLDISGNKIEDPEILDIIFQMPELAVLKMNGNPFVRKVQSYRKHVIASMPQVCTLFSFQHLPQEGEEDACLLLCTWCCVCVCVFVVCKNFVCML